MPDTPDLLSYLRVVAGVAAVLAGFYYLLRRSADDLRDTEADERGNASAYQPAPGQYDLVPRTLATNPFTQSSSPATLGSQIEAAAEASVRHGRTVGLVYFEFPVVFAVEKEAGGEAADALVNALAGDFRRAVRTTDHVAIINRDEIVVCICLLSSRKDLETIASRLSAAARRRNMIGEEASSLPVGLSIYPLDGYSGAELIKSARLRHQALMPSSGIETSAAADTAHDTGPTDAQTHKPPRSRRTRGPHKSHPAHS